MPKRDRYPAGVPCWIDSARPSTEAAAAFYRGVLGWELATGCRPASSETYFEAKVDGGSWPRSVLGQRARTGAVDDLHRRRHADEAAERVRAAGGRVIVEPHDVLDAGRMAMCADPEGAHVRGVAGGHPRRRRGRQRPWNVELVQPVTADPEAAKRFYGAVFGWEFDTFEVGGDPSVTVVVPGYGDYLESIDPGVRARHAEGGAPPGFTDTVAWFEPMDQGGPRWHVTFTVADADQAAARARELGGEVLVEPFDIPWQRIAVIRDPDGATFTAGQFKPPS